jgi:hypothetical protein
MHLVSGDNGDDSEETFLPASLPGIQTWKQRNKTQGGDKCVCEKHDWAVNDTLLIGTAVQQYVFSVLLTLEC